MRDAAKGDAEKYVLSRLDSIEDALGRLSVRDRNTAGPSVTALNAILNLLRSTNTPMRLSEMFTYMPGIGPTSLASALNRLVQDGLVVQWAGDDGHPIYKLSNPALPTEVAK
jgi:hypothetical protein